jgi:hypothetical protein
VGISPASLKRADVKKISTVEIFPLMRYNYRRESSQDGCVPVGGRRDSLTAPAPDRFDGLSGSRPTVGARLRALMPDAANIESEERYDELSRQRHT